MPDWDEDSAQPEHNLADVLTRISLSAPLRQGLTLDMAREWHQELLTGLSVPNEAYRGAFRGEPGLKRVGVRVGRHTGVSAHDVSTQLTAFQRRLHRIIEEFDAAIPAGSRLDADQLAAVLDLCAWAHAEWVRIHPFANGNGRIARLWANCLALRYGLPPFIRLRPRPNAGYAAAAAAAMEGNWQPTANVFRRFYLNAIGSVMGNGR